MRLLIIEDDPRLSQQLKADLERAAYDRAQAFAPERRPEGSIVVVAIDERSLAMLAEEFGRFPWPRSAAVGPAPRRAPPATRTRGSSRPRLSPSLHLPPPSAG